MNRKREREKNMTKKFVNRDNISTRRTRTMIKAMYKMRKLKIKNKKKKRARSIVVYLQRKRKKNLIQLHIVYDLHKNLILLPAFWRCKNVTQKNLLGIPPQTSWTKPLNRHQKRRRRRLFSLSSSFSIRKKEMLCSSFISDENKFM